MSRINFVPLIKQEGLQNAIVRNKKEPSPLIGYAKRIETYDDIVSLPSNANGQISVTVKGFTYTNLLGNYGDFETDSNGDGLADGWVTTAGAELTYSLVADCVFGKYAQKLTSNGSVGARHIYRIMRFYENHKYYVSAYVKKTVGTDQVQIVLYGTGLTSQIYRFSATSNFARYRTIFTIPAGQTADWQFAIYAHCNATGQTEEAIWDGVLVIDLTQIFGVGNEPTQEECDKIFNFVNSTKSTLGAIRLKSVGKNLLNLDAEYVNLNTVIDRDVITTAFKSGALHFNAGKRPIRLKPNTKYTYSVYSATDSPISMGLYVYDRNGTLLRFRDVINEISASVTITTPNDGFVAFCTNGIQGFYGEYSYRLQVEKGETPTEYEPYKESTMYLVAKDEEGNILELRSLPNGVKDEINVVEGKYTKKVSDTVSVTGTMFASLDTTTYVNVDVVKTTAFSDAMAGTTGKDGMTRLYDKNGVELTEVAQTDIDNPASVGKYYWHTDKTLWIIVAKGAYADIAAARTGLGTMTLNYQLASPIITKHEIFGDLKVFPSGTIYFEPTLWGFINFDYGQSSKTITTPDVPIGSIRKVIRYDVTDDGRLVETDVTADCTHNGTALTINNAEPKKTYFYDCEVAPGYYTSAEKIIDVGTHDGVVEHDYGAAAADWVLSTNEALATMLVCKNAGGAAKIIAPAAEGKMYIIRNVSGQTITIKTASSTGITVANGKTATVVFYNTDFIKIGEV